MTDAQKIQKYDAYLTRQREHSRNYRQAHKAERAAYYKVWYQRNKAKVAARRRKKRLLAQGLENEAK